MAEKVAVVIVCVLFIGLMVYVCWDSTIQAETMIYECTDYHGNIVYCTSAYTNKGGMFGITEDGTHIALTSYKQIPKTERKDLGGN